MKSDLVEDNAMSDNAMSDNAMSVRLFWWIEFLQGRNLLRQQLASRSPVRSSSEDEPTQRP